MYQNTTRQTRFPLEQQLIHHARSLKGLQAELERNSLVAASRVAEDLNRLSEQLNTLSQQVARREDDYQNLTALAEIGQVVNSSLDLNAVLQIVMDTIVRLSGAERGFLMLRNLLDGEMTIRTARNWEQESIAPNEFAISRTVIERVIQEGVPVLTTNAQEDPRFGGHESIIAYSLRSILCVPLKVKDILTGVIYTDNRIRTGIFSEADRNLLAAFANHAAVALENARLFESVRRTLAEVTELKNLMDNVFASIASGVITADIQDRITLCNRAAEAILGHPAAELIGRPLAQILPPLKTEFAAVVDRVRETNESVVGLEVSPVLPERGPVFWSLNLSPLKDATETTQGIAMVLDDLTEKKRLEAQRRLFARMVSPAVIEQLNPDQLQLGGKRAEITTLFADVRGFTRFSENLAPEHLFHILNQYLAAAAEAILEQEGTIDKFMGDAVMAWFNAPIPQPDHALRAIQAALAIKRKLHSLHASQPEDLRLSFGIGLHYGEALLGLVGTEKRLEYTAIGDSVNTAKRIQENSSANQILISGALYSLVADQIHVQSVEAIQAKGKREPLEVYEVTGLRN